jgi:hypothetical protein
MISIAHIDVQQLMTRSLRGARAGDPVVPEREPRLRRMPRPRHPDAR